MTTFRPLRVSMFFILIYGSSLVSGRSNAGPTEFVLRAKVRDFKELNPTDTVGVHPHFNDQNACNAAALGIRTVKADLDTDGPSDGNVFPGDNRTPVLADSLGAMARCYNPPERFSEWYADAGPAVNRSFLVDLAFKLDTAAGLYRFTDESFFPLDEGKAFAKADPEGPEPFGHLQTDTVDGAVLSRHNYGFTMELHTRFRYDEGAGQMLDYRGDDDIWVFMNGKLVLDFGGVHPSQSGVADLDSLQSILGLEDGETYPLDFYFAERHTASSSCMISTNMAFGGTNSVKPRPAAAFAAKAPSEVAIFDRSGRMIRRLEGGEAHAWGGPGAQGWDRRDAHGRTAAPGAYFWRSAAGKAAPAATGMFVIP